MTCYLYFLLLHSGQIYTRFLGEDLSQFSSVYLPSIIILEPFGSNLRSFLSAFLSTLPDCCCLLCFNYD